MRSTISERELGRWLVYAHRRMLPTRRLELYLAQIALQVARSFSGGEVSLQDFLFDPAPEQTPEEFFDYKPRVKHGQ